MTAGAALTLDSGEVVCATAALRGQNHQAPSRSAFASNAIVTPMAILVRACGIWGAVPIRLGAALRFRSSSDFLSASRMYDIVSLRAQLRAWVDRYRIRGESRFAGPLCHRAQDRARAGTRQVHRTALDRNAHRKRIRHRGRACSPDVASTTLPLDPSHRFAGSRDSSVASTTVRQTSQTMPSPGRWA